jgi:hypothetical protein
MKPKIVPTTLAISDFWEASYLLIAKRPDILKRKGAME